ncbi:uncharacterized protein NEMAJ01_0924 [Nematocida major]|uniref:uncharacterized protein n=1 Tax=Nematocida major TaxID=1912982 RepID=UPI0020080B46|nr:uncharacterized protein NEMAJ01_0924 [Nematocida major]KAH9386028.1 hypothetical protein NEMAJ01_0924 [Nematocida major]
MENSKKSAEMHADAANIQETEEEQIRRRREEYNEIYEKDDILFSATAILYRYQLETSSWVGRGKGKLRVSLEPTGGKHRITQIREKIFKLGCNHYIEPNTTLSKYPLAEHAWIWTTFGDDCGDGLDKAQKFLARFSSADDAEKFNAAVEAGKGAPAKKESLKKDESSEPAKEDEKPAKEESPKEEAEKESTLEEKAADKTETAHEPEKKAEVLEKDTGKSEPSK